MVPCHEIFDLRFFIKVGKFDLCGVNDTVEIENQV
jgi:hypothetical protein